MQQKLNNINLIYIAGYGRSGSTLMDRILNTSNDIIGTGELVHINNTVHDEYLSQCGCQTPQTKCDFWGSIIKELKSWLKENKLKSKENDFKKLEGIRGLLSKSEPGIFDLYNRYHELLFQKIADKSAPKIKYIADSSKTAWHCYKRPQLLSNVFKNIIIIHLVRDGRATAWSNIKNMRGKDSRGNFLKRKYIFIKTIISWNFANRYKKQYKYYYINYDVFCMDPEKIAHKLGEFLEVHDIDLKKINQKNHLYTGNASRFKQIDGIKPDTSWKNEITLGEHVIYYLLGFPFNFLKVFLQ